MSKKRTSKKRGFSLEDLQPVNVVNDALLSDEKPQEFFKDHETIGAALLQCLIDNDAEAFIEILDSYLRVNRSHVARKANLPRSTISLAFSKKGNPTIKTIAKIVHEAISLRN